VRGRQFVRRKGYVGVDAEVGGDRRRRAGSVSELNGERIALGLFVRRLGERARQRQAVERRARRELAVGLVLEGRRAAGQRGVAPADVLAAADPEPPESLTPIEKTKLPSTLGVPESLPSAESVRPGAKVPEVTAQLYGGVPPATPNCLGV
jgi:hypothetical protein